MTRFIHFAAVVVTVLVGGTGRAWPQQAAANLDEYVRLARTGIQQDKAQILGDALELDATDYAANDGSSPTLKRSS